MNTPPVDPPEAPKDIPPVTIDLILGALKRSAANVGRPAAAETVQDPPLGHVVAGYRLGRRLGRGGMAEVYEAIQIRLRRPVALKLLRIDPTRPEMAQRFLREARAMMQVRHERITAILDAGTDGPFSYLAMELMTGGDVGGSIDRRGRLPVDEAVRLISACCEGLGALHAAGLVHRDIKPGNIFLTADGEPKIGDFGLARQISGADRMTVTGASWGTPSYMAPEQIIGAADVDARADVYALGATFYTMLAGREPFSGETSYLTTYKAMTEPFPDPRTVDPTIPAAVASIIRMATDHQRERRYSSARHLHEDLQRLQQQQMLLHAGTVGTSTPATVTQAFVPRTAPTAAHRTAARPAAVGWSWGFGVLALAGVAWWWSGRPSPAAPAFPAWANTGGQDQAGQWVDLTIGDATTRLRYRPAGTVVIGSPPAESGRTTDEVQRSVTLTHGYWMQEGECDQAFFTAVMRYNPSRHRGADLPVEQVTWDDARAFCAALATRGVPARLPSEAEWEHACRAGTTTAYSASDPATVGWMAEGGLLQAWADGEAAARRFCAEHQEDLTLRPHPIGRRQANPAGFFDLHGNVLEWCADRWDGASHLPGVDQYVVRGGSWFHPPALARSAARMGLPADASEGFLGFRFVVSDALEPAAR